MRPRRSLLGFASLLAIALAAMPAQPALADGPLVALGPVRTTPAFTDAVNSLDPSSTYGAFVHFRGGNLLEHTRLLAGVGIDVVQKYPQIDVYFAVGTVADFRVLTWEPAVSYLEDDRQLIYHDETGPWATRSRVVQEAVAGGPYRDAAGQIIDGAGVGVAVIDSGINGAHPDLGTRIGKNYKVLCPGVVTLSGSCLGPLSFNDVGTATSDTSSGHGTHVAGIVAGDGTASTGAFTGAGPAVRGTFTGAAPGATLYGFGTGEGDSILISAATGSFQYIYDHFDEFSPKIRVINNSWGDANGTPYNPESAINKLVNSLVNEKKVTVTFAASNLGAGAAPRTGAADQTSSYSKNPTPGVISVANYDDGETLGDASGTGNRDNALSASSSGGRLGSDATYTDVSAPGTYITSSCVREVQPICNAGIIDEARWAPWYGTISGTSMASPHVAGVAALLYQADPTLTPAEVEDVLQDTAHKFTAGGPYSPDPQNLGGTHSYDKGAGLIDVQAALDALGVDHAPGGEQGTPAVHIVEPGDGADFNGSGSIVVSGTANDGVVPPVVPQEQLIFDGEGGDFSGPGAVDVVALSALETPAGTLTPGITYRITVRDASDFGGTPGGLPQLLELDLFQNLNGTPYRSTVRMSPTSVTAFTPSADPSGAPTSASRTGNVITFFVPFSRLGQPAAGSIAHNLRVIAYAGTYVETAPSPQDDQTTATDADARPMYGRAYSIARPGTSPASSVSVTVSVDNGLPTTAAVEGTSPDYTWTKSINAVTLTNGSHTLLATLLVNGLPAATHSSTFMITRVDPTYVYQVDVSNPADGATVPRAFVQVEGTSFTDDPATQRAVTVELKSALYSSGQKAASGESPWVVEFDFSKVSAGPYSLIARYSVAGVVKATRTISITVPVDPEIGCSPRNIDFWRAQYKRNSTGSLRFTDADANTIATRAATLSDGRFASSKQLLNALTIGGTQPERAADRQYATLLLNIAAGDVSGTMSYKAGLSGNEGLDPSVYATGVVGSTVGAAATWIRAQLPDRTNAGDLGGASEVANAINNAQGLDCG